VDSQGKIVKEAKVTSEPEALVCFFTMSKFSKTTVHGRDMASALLLAQMAGARALGRSQEKSFPAIPARPQMGHE
jgi:hypothetical protein